MYDASGDLEVPFQRIRGSGLVLVGETSDRENTGDDPEGSARKQYRANCVFVHRRSGDLFRAEIRKRNAKSVKESSLGLLVDRTRRIRQSSHSSRRLCGGSRGWGKL
jgi:hypothetical protein